MPQELNRSSPQSSWLRGFSGSWFAAGGFCSFMDRILGDSLAFAARARYWSHSTEPVKGTLLLLATAVAYVKGLEMPLLLGLRDPS